MRARLTLLDGPRRSRRMAFTSWSSCPSWLILGFLMLFVGTVAAQRGNTFGIVSEDEYTPDGSENQPYDGRVQFVRLGYSYGLASAGFTRRGVLAPWAHDHPRADRHFMKLMEELTLLRPRTDGSNTFGLDNPELFNFPMAYMSEPG